MAEEGDKISFKLSLRRESDFGKNNIFTTSADKNVDQSHINLISFYLLAGHHGGIVKLSDLSLEIVIPKNPNDQILIKSCAADVDDLIVSAML